MEHKVSFLPLNIVNVFFYAVNLMLILFDFSSSVKGGVDAKVLFGSYITNWIREKHVALLDFSRVSLV